jgi:hypothetical protein
MADNWGNQMKTYFVIAAAFAMGCGAVVAQDVGRNNFPDRRAVIINNAPEGIELSAFSFGNEYSRSSFRDVTRLKWKNVGQKPITAFEVIIRYYDPFNRPMNDGGRWMITGHDSANWTPLGSGETSGDGLIGFRSSEALTAMVYVRAIRFADGTVWTSNLSEVEQRLKRELPQLKDVGTLDPGPKKQPDAP